MPTSPIAFFRTLVRILRDPWQFGDDLADADRDAALVPALSFLLWGTLLGRVTSIMGSSFALGDLGQAFAGASVLMLLAVPVMAPIFVGLLYLGMPVEAREKNSYRWTLVVFALVAGTGEFLEGVVTGVAMAISAGFLEPEEILMQPVGVLSYAALVGLVRIILPFVWFPKTHGLLRWQVLVAFLFAGLAVTLLSALPRLL